jgi:hypothetical protein
MNEFSTASAEELAAVEGGYKPAPPDPVGAIIRWLLQKLGSVPVL